MDLIKFKTLFFVKDTKKNENTSYKLEGDIFKPHILMKDLYPESTRTLKTQW